MVQELPNPLSKLAVVSIDAVVNSDRRIARARKKLEHYESQFPRIGGGEVPGAADVYFQTLFDPALLSLDELLPGSQTALDYLSQHGYQVVLISPFPQSGRESQRAWFADAGMYLASPKLSILGLDWLVLCSRTMRGNLQDWYYDFYGKDQKYKTTVVELLVSIWEPETLLYVDPLEHCRTAIENADLPVSGTTLLAKDLEEAVRK